MICTKKKSLEDAIFYVRYVVQNITNKELFHSLQISLGSCWEYLMWLDSVMANIYFFDTLNSITFN